MDPVVVALAFAAIFVVELPDKTFIATLVLSTKFRPLFVWIGVGLAFIVQTLIAVALGKAVSFLPDDRRARGGRADVPIGAVHPAARGPFARRRRAGRGGGLRRQGRRGAGLQGHPHSFLVLFAAEWGDLSQLLTLSLVAKYDDPVSVFIGAWGALLAVSGLAVIVGRVLLSRIRLSLLHYLGAGVCLLMACLTVWEMTRA